MSRTRSSAIRIAVILIIIVAAAVLVFAQTGGKGDQHVNANANKPSDTELRQKLTPLQYEVTQHEGTERAFDNEYWNNHQPGIYVDVVSGEALFSSLDKFDSGTGWPSFTRVLERGNVVEKSDRKLWMVRTEGRS